MKICVLAPSYRDSSSAFRDLDPPRDVSRLLPEHDVTHVFLDKATCLSVLEGLEADVFVNLCDGVVGEDIPGVEITIALERRGAAYTGAHPAFYDPTREEMKRACEAHGVPTPAHVFADDAEGVERAVRELRLPAFVKPRHGYSSVGITASSRAQSAEALRVEAARVIAEFGGALIEEYVDGREVSVLVASDPEGSDEPIVYPPVECLFAPGMPYKTFDYKWRASKNPWIPCVDRALAEVAMEQTRAIWRALGGSGYARSDIRVDPSGKALFLELNPNCGIFYDDDDGGTADVILDLSGKKKAEFLRGMIAHALRRRRLAASVEVAAE